jgi:hypothetical protein
MEFVRGRNLLAILKDAASTELVGLSALRAFYHSLNIATVHPRQRIVVC